MKKICAIYTRKSTDERLDMEFNTLDAQRESCEAYMFDLPSAELKKLIQGIVWRDEHFAGKTLTEIARREKCSDAHVGKCIMHSFDLL